MNTKQIAAYGTWSSPIVSASITTDSVSLDEVHCHSSGNYWIEKRPEENGRCVIVRHTSEEANDILPAPFSARSRVHEYGGGVYCVSKQGLFFVNDSDQNIYFFDQQSQPQNITSNDNCCYADLKIDEIHNHLLCICQTSSGNDVEPENTLITVNLTSGETTTLCTGYDFYSSPRISPCGKKLAWLCWNHPDMPWDGTELWLADIKENYSLSNKQCIAGSASESIFQPEWSPDGILTYVSDSSGWWNIYQYRDNKSRALTNEHAEFGLPQWVFCQSTYTYINNHEILCAPVRNGTSELSILNTETKSLNPLKTLWNSFSSLHSFNGEHCFIAASEKNFPAIIHFNSGNGISRAIRTANSSSLDKSCFSYGETIEFDTRHTDKAFAIYYAPKSCEFVADEDQLPPLIVITHGGPTAMSTSALDIRKQYWTSRGFAVLDVNYSGSTGFGRAYRERLNTNWGIRDAEDCCDAALHMVKLGLADPKRLIIKGSSAGGYTVLCALTFHDTFSAGASYYGIGELESLLEDTHKFESRYLDRLIGAYPQHAKRYHQRSPLHHVEQLNCPVIFFQGTEDKVVPKEQAEKMFNALKKKGMPVAYLAFEGEQHGFRKAGTLKKTLDAELYFYSRIFNIPVNDENEIDIENID